MVLRVCWDHKVPYAYSQNNRITNYAAACQICNSLKAALMFATVEETQIYVCIKAEEKGFSDVSPVLGEVRPDQTLAKIL